MRHDDLDYELRVLEQGRRRRHDSDPRVMIALLVAVAYGLVIGFVLGAWLL